MESNQMLTTTLSHQRNKRQKKIMDKWSTWLSPFNARILVLGFISAESAVIGLLRGCIGILISMITTLFCGAVSRTHIYLSDSIVTCVNVINCGLIPKLGNCKYIKTINPDINSISLNHDTNAKFFSTIKHQRTDPHRHSTDQIHTNSVTN